MIWLDSAFVNMVSKHQDRRNSLWNSRVVRSSSLRPGCVQSNHAAHGSRQTDNSVVKVHGSKARAGDGAVA